MPAAVVLAGEVRRLRHERVLHEEQVAAADAEQLGEQVRHVLGPVVDQVGCLHCHQPHAATQKKLLNEDVPTLCWKCHSDTKQWQERLAGPPMPGR